MIRVPRNSYTSFIVKPSQLSSFSFEKVEMGCKPRNQGAEWVNDMDMLSLCIFKSPSPITYRESVQRRVKRAL